MNLRTFGQLDLFTVGVENEIQAKLQEWKKWKHRAWIRKCRSGKSRISKPYGKPTGE